MNRPLLLGISFVQGLLMLVLYLAAENDSWPATNNLWAFPLWTLVVSVPLILLLTLTRDNLLRVVPLAAGLAAVLVATAFYAGWLATPEEHVGEQNVLLLFVLSSGLALFKGLMYLQQRANQEPFTYEIVFKYSWRNFLTVVLAGGVALGVALVLLLWAALFDAIGVEFFADLFSQSWFLFPVLSVSFGGGVIILRDLTRIIDSVNGLLEGLIRLLLPLLVVVAILFTATLPFVGLQPLWNTGNGTALLLWLIALMLFFINAVYQTGQTQVLLSRWVQIAVGVGVLTLPVLCALGFYGLYLRVDQYGWSVGRCWAVLVWSVLTVFSVSYFVGVVRYRLAWPAALARSNIYIGWGVLALMILANSPLLDFRSISLHSQIARVDRGEISWQEFDFYHLKNDLGRHGWMHGQALIEQFPQDTALHEKINEPLLAMRARYIRGAPQRAVQVYYRPAEFRPPQAVLDLMISHAYLADTDRYYLQVNMDADEQLEIVELLLFNKRIAQSFLYDTDDQDAWRRQQIQVAQGGITDVHDMLTNGAIRMVQPRYQLLEIGDLSLQVSLGLHVGATRVVNAVGEVKTAPIGAHEESAREFSVAPVQDE